MNDLINDYIALLRADALKMFPGATSVSIFINVEGVSVQPSYNGQLCGKSMQTIDGGWCSKWDRRCPDAEQDH